MKGEFGMRFSAGWLAGAAWAPAVPLFMGCPSNIRDLRSCEKLQEASAEHTKALQAAQARAAQAEETRKAAVQASKTAEVGMKPMFASCFLQGHRHKSL